jgi:hypothetical protein
MRGVVIAKLLILTLWGSYLAVGLTQHTGDGRSANRIAATTRYP